MSYIIWSIFLWLLVIAGFTGWKYFKSKPVEQEEPKRDRYDRERIISLSSISRVVCFLTFITCVVIWVFSTAIAMINQIPAGQVGITYRFGSIVGQIEEGLQFTPPWVSVKVANVQTVSYKFPKLECFSAETQDVTVSATLNTNISAKDIQTLYRSVGPNFFAVLIAPRVEQNFKDETVKYKSIDIAPNREVIRKIVRTRLEKELEQHSIRVTDLLLENIDFKPGFKQAIEAKQIATQDALKEEQVIKIRKAQADQKVETAKGDAESIFIMAQKQAKANEVLNASLTANLIQYTMINKLSDKISVMMIPPGQGFIMDKSMLK